MGWLSWVFVALQYAPKVFSLVKDIIDHLHGAQTKFEADARMMGLRKACNGEFCISDTKGLG